MSRHRTAYIGLVLLAPIVILFAGGRGLRPGLRRAALRATLAGAAAAVVAAVLLFIWWDHWVDSHLETYFVATFIATTAVEAVVAVAARTSDHPSWLRTVIAFGAAAIGHAVWIGALVLFSQVVSWRADHDQFRLLFALILLLCLLPGALLGGPAAVVADRFRASVR